MKFDVKSLLVTCLFVASANADLTISGIATSVTPITAAGTLNGVGWTATTTASSPFVGINLPAGTWDLGTALPANALFLATSNVNAGDTQTFVFDQPVQDICFFIENFDSNSAANIVTDGTLSMVSATPDITFTSSTPSSGTLETSNSSFDGVGDVILKLSGLTSYIQFDYTGGEQANGIFYGFAASQAIVTTAVPEPSSFLFLAACGCGIAFVRRKRLADGNKVS